MNQSNTRPSPRYVTCPCQHCGKGIEFDASNFSENETRTVECPHCHLETLIFVPRTTTPKSPPQLALNPSKKWGWIGGVIVVAGICVFALLNNKYNPLSWQRKDTVIDGDVSVKILSVNIGPVLVSNGEGLGVTPTADCFQIWVQISDLSQTRKIDFVTWRAKELNENLSATLTDNNGNVYQNYAYQSPIYGQSDQSTIYPGQSIEDLITFQIPVQNRKWLHLALPSSNFGSSGILRFEITNSFGQ